MHAATLHFDGSLPDSRHNHAPFCHRLILIFYEKDNAVAEPHNLAGLDGAQSVSALGLRWAALRGMLNSPLITGDDQRALRDELLRELASIEQDFGALQSRNPMEISAKVDIAKAALRERIQTGETWLIDLLDSIQGDLQVVSIKPSSSGPANRTPVNLTRTHQQRPDEGAIPAGTEAGTSSAA
jgi:hypothetical protein